MARCHRATLVLLVCGILMHYRIYCSSIGLRYPKIRSIALLGMKTGCGGAMGRAEGRGKSRGEMAEPWGEPRGKGRAEGRGKSRGESRGESHGEGRGESCGERGEPWAEPWAEPWGEPTTERRAEEVVASTLREILGQLTARQYLTALMMIPVGEESRMEDESEPLSKRHSDGIFTDGYSRYRKHMAMKKYLEAVLGRRYRQRFRNKVWRLTYL
ncbi:adenylate cyclase activating polypeptide 1b [Oncorhynchus clarkii lewisi]|uniref:adenylate cyclase activating polypeptide 1b n=1 Tax=Oncorhynchus clarkii lewisi TaxID=490388 RepID=UPI0039B882CF